MRFAGPTQAACIAAKTTTATFKNDVYAFIFGHEGLMAGVGLQCDNIIKINLK